MEVCGFQEVPDDDCLSSHLPWVPFLNLVDLIESQYTDWFHSCEKGALYLIAVSSSLNLLICLIHKGFDCDLSILPIPSPLSCGDWLFLSIKSKNKDTDASHVNTRSNITLLFFFIWLQQVLVAACGIFSCGRKTLSCDMWDLVPWPGIEPRDPAWWARNLSYWTTREIPQ